MPMLGTWVALVSALQGVTQQSAVVECTVASQSLFTIRDPAGDLLAATGVVPFAGNRVAIAGATPGSVSVFSTANGRLVGRAGRVGSGPGEFRSAEAIGVSGDSVVVWDRSLRRISMVTAMATVARGFPLELDRESASLAYDIQPVGMLDAHRMLLAGRQGVGLGAAAGIRRDSVSYLALQRGSQHATVLGRFGGPEMATLRVAGGLLAVVDRPLGTPLLVTPFGAGILVNSDGAAVLRPLPGGGAPWRLDVPRHSPTAASVNRARRAAVDGAGDMPQELVAEISAAVDKVAAPTVMPAIDRLLTDGTHAWVREAYPEHRGATMQRWHRLDASGTVSGALDLPVSWRVLGFFAGVVMAVEESDDGEGIIRGWSVRC